MKHIQFVTERPEQPGVVCQLGPAQITTLRRSVDDRGSGQKIYINKSSRLEFVGNKN